MWSWLSQSWLRRSHQLIRTSAREAGAGDFVSLRSQKSGFGVMKLFFLFHLVGVGGRGRAVPCRTRGTGRQIRHRRGSRWSAQGDIERWPAKETRMKFRKRNQNRRKERNKKYTNKSYVGRSLPSVRLPLFRRGLVFLNWFGPLRRFPLLGAR